MLRKGRPMFPTKIINDPIYGFIKINNPLIVLKDRQYFDKSLNLDLGIILISNLTEKINTLENNLTEEINKNNQLADKIKSLEQNKKNI